MAKKQQDPPEHWLSEPEEKHFLAATNYLSLLFLDADAASMVENLRNTPAISREANDLLRASRLELLPEAMSRRKQRNSHLPSLPVRDR